MYKIIFTNRFKKDVVKCYKRGLDLSLLETAVEILRLTGTLPPQYKMHPLKGNLKGFYECHLQNDWLLVWKQNEKELILKMLNTGTHSDLFK